MMGPIYVITDPGATMPVHDQARAAAQGGASLIQIRDKHASDHELAGLVTSLLPELSQLGVKLILNDRVDLAVATGAHGLHIGQSDGDPVAIRQRIGSTMILGLSIETEDQARLIASVVDYIGAGPVRPTATKPDHAPPIGFDGLARIARSTEVPCYAIGGLKSGDAASVKATGAVGMALVSSVTRQADPAAATRALLGEWNAA